MRARTPVWRIRGCELWEAPRRTGGRPNEERKNDSIFFVTLRKSGFENETSTRKKTALDTHTTYAPTSRPLRQEEQRSFRATGRSGKLRDELLKGIWRSSLELSVGLQASILVHHEGGHAPEKRRSKSKSINRKRVSGEVLAGGRGLRVGCRGKPVLT